MSYPRTLAARVLTRVLSDSQPLDEAMAAIQGEIKAQDRAWLQEICSGTIRWKGRLDQILDSTSLKKKPTGWLRKMLLLTSYQLVAQDRAPVARVVSETVTEIKSKEGEAPANFANAVLRKIGDHGKSWRTLGFPTTGTAKEAAQWASLPEWLWPKLVKAYGLEWAKAFAIATLDRPTLWIRSKDEAKGIAGAELGSVPGSYRIVPTEDAQMTPVPTWQGFESGQFLVQDVSSQFLIHEVCKQAKQIFKAQSEITALDLCAAPGGKAIGMAWNGLKVYASDQAGPRFELLKQSVQRADQSIQLISPDKLSELALVDLVWVDAPCSGTGILRRHPDVRWLRKEKELASLHEVQLSLVRKGWDRLKPGGLLVYSVCSVLKEEGPELLEAAQLKGEKLQQWFLTPQEQPFGDGFWGGVIRKV